MASPKSPTTSALQSHQFLSSPYAPDNILTSTIFSIGPSLLKNSSTFLTCIGLSNFFSLKPCFLANSELITNPVAPLSNKASTVIPFCVSNLSNPIFTVTSLNILPSVFLTLVFSFSDASAFILLANTLYLLGEPSWGILDSLPLLNCSNCSLFPRFFPLYTPPSYSPLLSLSNPYSCSCRPCAWILHKHNSSSPYLPPLWKDPV